MQTPAGELLKNSRTSRRTNEPDVRGRDRKQIREQAPDHGAIIGYAMATHHSLRNKRDVYIAPTGTKVGLLFPRAAQNRSEGGFDTFTVVGYFKSGMSEYDSTHVYVPLERLAENAAR